MRGHTHVIDMRRDRMKPSTVFLQVGEDPPASWEENPYYYERFPHVFIGKDERFSQLDLRFLVGLDVQLLADSLPRMAEALYACKEAHAKNILAVVFDPERHEVTHLYDSRTQQWLTPKT